MGLFDVRSLMNQMCLNPDYVYDYIRIKNFFKNYTEDERRTGRITEFIENSPPNFFKRFFINEKWLKNVIFNLVCIYLPCSIEYVTVYGSFDRKLEIVFEFRLVYKQYNTHYTATYRYGDTFPVHYNISIIELFLAILKDRSVARETKLANIDELKNYSNLYNIYNGEN